MTPGRIDQSRTAVDEPAFGRPASRPDRSPLTRPRLVAAAVTRWGIGLLLSLSACGSDEDVAPPSRRQDAPLTRMPVDAREAENDGRSRSESETGPAEVDVFDLERGGIVQERGAGEPNATTEPVSPEPVEGAGVLVEVVDAVTRAEIANFRLIPSDADGNPTDRPVESQGPATFPVELGGSAFVLVEADDYEPSGAIELALETSETTRRVRIELQKSALNSGVELTVWRPDTSPAPKIEVRLERRELAAAFDAPFAFVWERAASHPEGRYGFPELRPGHYRAHIQAVDEEGQPELLLPELFEFDFEGVSLFQQTIVLRPGGQIRLAILDPATGEHLARNDVNVWLLGADGTERDVLWATREGDRRLVGDGTLPKPTACLLAEPIEPGGYTLRVRRRVATAVDPAGVQTIETPLTVFGGSVSEQTIR